MLEPFGIGPATEELYYTMLKHPEMDVQQLAKRLDWQEERVQKRGEEVVHYTRQAITALGIVDGAAHTEVMLTARGPVLIETGARLMGSTQPRLHAEYSGTSHVHLLALALTEPEAFARFPDDDIRWSRRIRQVYLNNKRAGHCRSER